MQRNDGSKSRVISRLVLRTEELRDLSTSARPDSRARETNEAPCSSGAPCTESARCP
jgi:hypothetical protein